MFQVECYSFTWFDEVVVFTAIFKKVNEFIDTKYDCVYSPCIKKIKIKWKSGLCQLPLRSGFV